MNIRQIRQVQVAITIGALLVAAAHVWWPALAIDAVTVTLILAAMVPWLAPLFRRLKLPGGWEIEFHDLQQTKERAEKAGLLAHAEPKDSASTSYSFQAVADDDPNLALAGLRIEIERRLVQLAKASGIDATRRGVGALLRLLGERQLITSEQKSVLSDMLDLLNRAVHGATVPKDSCDWAVQVGPKLLGGLDELIGAAGGHA